MIEIMPCDQMREDALRLAKNMGPNSLTEEMPTVESLAAAFVAERCVAEAFLRWGPTVIEGPSHSDIVFASGYHVDVKNLDADHKTVLLWPRRKGFSELERREFDAFVLTRFHIKALSCKITRCVSRLRFIEACKVAGTEDGHAAYYAPSLWLGSLYMDEDDLPQIERLEGIFLERAKRLAVAAYWSNPNDETFLAAADATKALNGGNWP